MRIRGKYPCKSGVHDPCPDAGRERGKTNLVRMYRILRPTRRGHFNTGMIVKENLFPLKISQGVEVDQKRPIVWSWGKTSRGSQRRFLQIKAIKWPILIH